MVVPSTRTVQTWAFRATAQSDFPTKFFLVAGEATCRKGQRHIPRYVRQRGTFLWIGQHRFILVGVSIAMFGQASGGPASAVATIPDNVNATFIDEVSPVSCPAT